MSEKEGIFNSHYSKCYLQSLSTRIWKDKDDHIVPKHIMNYQNKVINTYSAKHLKKIHAVLSAIFNFSIKFHGLTNNPARITGNFEKESNKRMNFWEFEEYKQFISVVNELLYKAFFLRFIIVVLEKGIAGFNLGGY